MYMSARQIIILFIVLTVLSIGIIVMSRQNVKRQETNVVVPTSTTAPVRSNNPRGSLTLRDTGRSSVFKKGDTIPLTVIADSFQMPIVGYDVVVQYDPDTVAYKNVNNLQKEFDVVPAVQANRVILTGIKKLEIKEGTKFSSTPLAELTFEATSEGPAAFSIVFEKGKTNDSNLMTDTNEDILDTIKTDTIAIGQPVELEQGIETKIDNGVVSITLTATEKSPPNCNDCIESASLQVTKDGQTETVKFQFGGFAGLMQSDAEAFGYVFHVDTIQSGSVNLYYYIK